MLSYIKGCDCDFHKKMNRCDEIFDDFDEMVDHFATEYYIAKKRERKFKVLGLYCMNELSKKDRKIFLTKVKKSVRIIDKKNRK